MVKPFFQLIEKTGLRKAVYSESDLRYMMARGWNPIVIPPAVIEAMEEAVLEVMRGEVPEVLDSIAFDAPSVPHRKRGRPRKVR